VLELNPNNVNAWCNKGYCLEMLGKYQKAIECFDKAIKIFDFKVSEPKISKASELDPKMLVYGKIKEPPLESLGGIRKQ